MLSVGRCAEDIGEYIHGIALRVKLNGRIVAYRSGGAPGVRDSRIAAEIGAYSGSVTAMLCDPPDADRLYVLHPVLAL